MLTRNRWEGRSGEKTTVNATYLAYVFRADNNNTMLSCGLSTPSGGIEMQHLPRAAHAGRRCVLPITVSRTTFSPFSRITVSTG